MPSSIFANRILLHTRKATRVFCKKSDLSQLNFWCVWQCDMSDNTCSQLLKNRWKTQLFFTDSIQPFVVVRRRSRPTYYSVLWKQSLFWENRWYYALCLSHVKSSGFGRLLFSVVYVICTYKSTHMGKSFYIEGGIFVPFLRISFVQEKYVV